MFRPKYTITNRLLAFIKEINSLIPELNNRSFPKVVLYEFEKEAQAISSHASTSIEGNPLSLTEVRKMLKSKPAYIRDTEREVLNYNGALKWLDRKIASGKLEFDLDLILEIHRQVVEGLLPDKQLGQLRTEPVFVNEPTSGQPVYSPPDASAIDALMKELVVFVNENQGQIDPLISAGIFHKQFVIVHPFMDGNGRTARLSTKALLAKLGINTFSLFSFENYYNQNVTKYFQKVGLFGDYYDLVEKTDFTEWLEYFAEGVIDELLRVKGLLYPASLSPAEQLKSYHQKILDFIKENGYITDRDYAKLTSRAKSTRSLDFKFLIQKGLVKRKGKGRATYYILSR